MRTVGGDQDRPRPRRGVGRGQARRADAVGVQDPRPARRRPGATYTRRQIMEHLWGSTFTADEHTCEVHVSALRRKIERDPRSPERLVTVRGVGYTLRAASIRPGRRPGTTEPGPDQLRRPFASGSCRHPASAGKAPSPNSSSRVPSNVMLLAASSTEATRCRGDGGERAGNRPRPCEQERVRLERGAGEDRCLDPTDRPIPCCHGEPVTAGERACPRVRSQFQRGPP